MTNRLNESTVEQAAMEWLQDLGYEVKNGSEIAPGESDAERSSFRDVLLLDRLRAAMTRLNPSIPAEALEDALRKVQQIDAGSLVQNNLAFHAMIRDGVPVEYRRSDRSIAGDRVHLVDFENRERNDWLVVNQFSITEGQKKRRPDLLIFVNGLPIGIIELKNVADEEATIWTAWGQLQTYKKDLPTLFQYNELMVVSDGTSARVGSLTANREWFKLWRNLDEPSTHLPGLELCSLIHGVFRPENLLKILQHYITFEKDKNSDQIHKIIAGYHQFHAAQEAVKATVTASQPGGDQRGGVVWHTQGSGKSFSMLFYAGQIIQHPAMKNPTLVVLTDRNDLDDQLFGQFQRCSQLLRQEPIQADSVAHLKELLQVASGGVIFTTIQKFHPGKRGERMPRLSDRRNIVVIADEAHRSQYDLIDGLARNLREALPGASFIGFTGTPIEQKNANTRAVFGDYVSIYDIQQAVEDEATVPIYYESRIARLGLNESELPRLDEDFEEITEGEESERKEKLKTKWAALEALVGHENRVNRIAEDLVQHFERRLEGMEGKAMIVGMSRRICVDLYDAIIRLRPEWAGEENDDVEAERKKKTVLKVVMTGAAHETEWQSHIRSKRSRKQLAERFKNPEDPFRIVIVRDMWLTGFDAPSLHTMYIDKPMRGHGMMQAIARVNRVFRDKPGGLVVDYLGLADQLKKALATYTESGGKGSPTLDPEEAVVVLREKYEICCDLMYGFDWSKWVDGTASERLALIPAGQEHVLQQENGKDRFTQMVTQLSQAFALCASHESAREIIDDIAFFQAVRAALMKSCEAKRPFEELDFAVRQLVSKAILADDEIIDVFTAAGMNKPDISILSEAFLAEVEGLKHKNVAVELLRKLLQSEIQARATRNLVEARQFSEMLKQTLNAYHNRAIATQEILEELMKLAREIRDAKQRGESLGLTEDEAAFYSALAVNDSARDVMGESTLKVIAAELVTKVRESVTIDWTLRESARAKIRVMVRRILTKHGYPPDLAKAATKVVLEQAEALCADWAV